MTDFLITAPDGKKYRVTGQGTQEQAVAALKKMLGIGAGTQEAAPEVVYEDGRGGRVTRGPAGLSFSSPGYSTNDQTQIARIMGGASGAETARRGVQEQIVSDRPIASRAAAALQGVPFVGEYADEAVGTMFGDRARDTMRASQDAMRDTRPGQTTALQIGTGVAASLPVAAALAPGMMAGGGTLGAQTIRAAGVGAALGGAEGAVSGFGAGNEGDRAGEALNRAGWGAGLGGVIGAAAPSVAAGISNLVQRFRGTDVAAISRELGVSPEAARTIRTALLNEDFRAASAALRNAGPTAMLADAGRAAQTLLDAAIATGGKAGNVARNAIERRAAGAADDMRGTLDRVLGSPEGRNTLSRNIREGTQDARRDAYDLAYSQPIDYSQGAGRTIEQILPRIPQSAINRANELMRMEGAQSAQIMAQIGQDGRVTFVRMPDVRQLDYIARALGDVADSADGQGKLGGTTQLGNVTRNLQKALRGAVRTAVPEYGAALDVAADAITRRNATELGYSMLRPGTTREAVTEAMTGASVAEREAAKQGLRSYIDDTLANVSRTITDPNVDARQAIKLVRDMSSGAAREKMIALLGQRPAMELMRELDKAATGLELRAAVAANSKTAIRQRVQGTVDEQTAPGALGTLMQGEPINATKRIVQLMTGQTPEAVALRQQGIYDEIAGALTTMRGNDARRALVIVRRAMAEQPITEAQARFVGRTLAGAGALTGYQAGSQALPMR